MPTVPLKITIPDDITFSDLKLDRDPKTGAVTFEWSVIERILDSSHLDRNLFRHAGEDNIGNFLIHWYFEHLAHGGDHDPVADELIREVEAEDAVGGGFSFPVGHA